MIYEDELPPHVEIRKTDIGYGLFTKKSFKRGELVYEQKVRFENQSSFDMEKKYYIKVNSETYEIDPKTHTIFYEGNVLLHTWDAFLNHRCEPNISDGEDGFHDGYYFYNKYALKDIEEGSELTTNYLQFCEDDEISFDCKCKSDICFGNIKGWKYLTPEQIAICDSQYITPRINKK